MWMLQFCIANGGIAEEKINNISILSSERERERQRQRETERETETERCN